MALTVKKSVQASEAKAVWEAGGWNAGEPVVIGVDMASGPDKTVVSQVPPTIQYGLAKFGPGIKAQSTSFVHATAAASAAIQNMHKALGSEVEVEAEQSVAQHKYKPQLGQTEVQAMVYELAVTERKLAEIDAKELLKRKEELRKELLNHIAPDAPLDTEVTFTDTEGNVVQFSAAPEQQVLKDDMKSALITTIGAEQFMALAKITITDLKKILSGNELKKFCEIKPGTRVMKVVVK